MSGIIGEIEHTILKQPLNDEIRFSIPVTNNTGIEQCYLVKLYDQSGTYIAKAPTSMVPGQFANKIVPNGTELMIINSNSEFWHINTIAGQTVTFKLFADPSYLGVCGYFDSSYTEVFSVEYDVAPYYEDDKEKAMWLILFVVIIAAFLFAKLS